MEHIKELKERGRSLAEGREDHYYIKRYGDLRVADLLLVLEDDNWHTQETLVESLVNQDYNSVLEACKIIIEQHEAGSLSEELHARRDKIDFRNHYEDTCNELGWSVDQDGEDVSLSQYSPAGEDFFFTVSRYGFVKSVEQYAESFDVDEHVELWVDSRGQKGVPKSIEMLVEDAKAIKEMLVKLAEALKKGA